MQADLLITNARIWVARGRTVSSMAVKDGRIVALDDPNLEARETLDLGGKHVFPGWNDAHVHVWKVGHRRAQMPDLPDVNVRVVPTGVDMLAAQVQRLSSFELRVVQRDDSSVFNRHARGGAPSSHPDAGVGDEQVSLHDPQPLPLPVCSLSLSNPPLPHGGRGTAFARAKAGRGFSPRHRRIAPDDHHAVIGAARILEILGDHAVNAVAALELNADDGIEALIANDFVQVRLYRHLET